MASEIIVMMNRNGTKTNESSAVSTCCSFYIVAEMLRRPANIDASILRTRECVVKPDPAG